VRKHLTYANVAATLALVFAMSGGALAAKHYLISSTKQINPKVLKKLKGRTGKTGAPGKTGAAGAAGKEGPQGRQGVEGKAAPAQQTISSSAASVAFGPPKSAEAVSEVSLPAGTYTLLASTVAQNNSAAPDDANCVFLDGGETFDEEAVKPGAKETAYIALPAVLLTVTAPSEQLHLACKSEDTAEGAFVNAQLIARKE
jgi:hypothetical protein